MKASTFMSLICALCLCLILPLQTRAADFAETQLVAVPATCQRVIDVTCVTEPCPRPCVPLPTSTRGSEVNCLLGIGASMRPNNPNDATQGFDPLTITYFGRTTCNRPVPNTGGNAFDLVFGTNIPIQISGQAYLYKVLESFDPQARTLVSTATTSYNEVALDNWGVSRGYFTRSLNADHYSVGHTARLVLPDGWAWVSLPSECRGNLSNIATCQQASAPFFVGPNPGEPSPRP